MGLSSSALPRSSWTPGEAKQHAISRLRDAYVKLAPSSLEGVGVFALRDILPGVEVMRWDWQKYESVVVHEDELRDAVPGEVFNQLRRIWNVDENGYVVVPLDFTATVSYINFLNHSPEPNLRYRYADGAYVTTRFVRSEEELCINYDRDYFPGYTEAIRKREFGRSVNEGSARPNGGTYDTVEMKGPQGD